MTVTPFVDSYPIMSMVSTVHIHVVTENVLKVWHILCSFVHQYLEITENCSRLFGWKGREAPSLFGSLERANTSDWTSWSFVSHWLNLIPSVSSCPVIQLAQFNGPIVEGAIPFPPSKDENKSSVQNFLFWLENQKMDDVLKTSNSIFDSKFVSVFLICHIQISHLRCCWFTRSKWCVLLQCCF